MKETILIVDDDKGFRVATLALLKDNGYTVTAAANGKEAKKILTEERVDLVLSDLVMEGMNGIELLQWIRASVPGTPVMMITGFGSINTAVEAMRLGAYDYITKPCDNDELLIKIRRVLQEQQKDRELRRLREEIREQFSFGNIVSKNERMNKIFKLVNQVCETDVTVLVLGETGTGKELLAKAIHYNSTRKNKPFVVITCSALSETLLESELFGHEKGAFTGAQKLRIGKFEDAQGGTVFLDEVGDVPLHLQTKLLRVLQEKEIERVGGNHPIPVDVRVIAATNRNLSEMMKAGAFREDLFYRLNVFPLQLPPLRERMDDMPILVEHFLQKHTGLANGTTRRLSPSATAMLMGHDWRGNIRELENVIKRAIIQTEGEIIQTVDLPATAAGDVRPYVPRPAESGEIPFKEYIKKITYDAESRYLVDMLARHQGNIKVIAELMDVDRKTIYRKIEEFGIDVTKYRQSMESS
ncbi:MAG: sigma-54 dependent transcriptional regulator [Bacteroidota bacterium]